MMDPSNASDTSDEESTSAIQDPNPVAEEDDEPDLLQMSDSPKPPASPSPDPSLMEDINQPGTSQSMDDINQPGTNQPMEDRDEPGTSQPMEDKDQPGTSQSKVSNKPRKGASKVVRIEEQPKVPRPAARPPTTNLSLLIYMAVATCQRKSGLSMQALKKIVTNMGYDMKNKKQYFLRSIKGMLAKGQLTQVKGTGATGSFKVNPQMGKKKNQPKAKGRGQQAKKADKKKKAVATSQVGVRSKTKKQGKVTRRITSRASKGSKTLTLAALRDQVKV